MMGCRQKYRIFTSNMQLRKHKNMIKDDLISRWNAEHPDVWSSAAAVRPGGKGTKASVKADFFFCQ
jgi:hypothetical protein